MSLPILQHQIINMKVKLITFVFSLVILHFAFLTFNLQKAYAEEVNLKVSPATLQIRAQAPADIRAPFTIENQGADVVDLVIILKRFHQDDTEAGSVVFSYPQLTNDRDRDLFFKNVQVIDDGFVTQTITLGPKQNKQLELQIALDEKTPTSDHYFSLVFVTKPKLELESLTKREKDTSFSIIQASIALPVLLSIVDEKERDTASIDTFSAPFLLQSGPVPFSLKVKNSGEHFITARGIVLIKNMFGQIVGEVEIPPTNILAGSTRSLQSKNISEVTDSGTYSLVHPEVLWPEQFLFGFYTATLSLSLSPEDILYTRSVYFFAFPFVWLIGVLFISFVALAALTRIKKKISEQT